MSSLKAEVGINVFIVVAKVEIVVGFCSADNDDDDLVYVYRCCGFLTTLVGVW